MKKSIIISMMILCVLIMCSCRLETGEFLELALCGSYAVPGCFSSDLKGATPSTEVLDRDEYGRILFLYEAVNLVSGETEESLVICQKLDEDYVYYYEDICYSRGDISEEAIETLKSGNDWGKPLNDSLMSGRENLISLDLCIQFSTDLLSYGKVRDAICNHLGITEQNIKISRFQDRSPSGHELYIISTSFDQTETYYLAIISPDYVVSGWQEIETMPSAREIAELKTSAGWEYGR